MSLSANEIVKVVASISPTGLLRRDFGRALLVTTDKTLSPAERTNVFSGTTPMAEIFPVGSAPMDAGNIYFQQDPYPKNLVVGRWITTDEPGHVLGGAPVTLGELTGINNGSFLFSAGAITEYGEIATPQYEVTGLDFSSALSLSDVAAVIEVAIQATSSAATDLDVISVTFDAVAGGFRIIFTYGTDGISKTGFSDLFPATSGTDVSALLGLASYQVQQNFDGSVSEPVEDALNAMVASDGTFYFLATETALNDSDTIDEISVWASTRDYMFSAESNDLAAIAGNASTFADLFALQPQRTFGTWSGTGDYKALSAAGRMGAINFNARNSLITLKFKQLPGTLPDAGLSETQAQNLQAIQANFYSERSGAPMYEEGYTFKKGTWIDVRYWLDWFVDSVRVEVFNAFYASDKIPQTEAGANLIKDAITLVCEAGIENAGIAPGQLSPALKAEVQAVTGNATFDGYLTAGYLVYCAPVATMSQADRDARKLPPFQVYLKGSGAAHGADILVTFEN